MTCSYGYDARRRAGAAAHRPHSRRRRVSRALTIPVQSQSGRVLGFFEVHRRKAGSGFSHAERETLVRLARLAAVGIQKTLAHRRTLHALDAVQRNETRYRGIIDSAVEGISQTTPRGQILTANPALAHMLGYDSPEDLVENVTDIGRQLYDDPRQRLRGIREIVKRGILTGFEARLRRKDGSVIWVSLNGRVVRDRSGVPRYFESFLQDISARKRAEEQHLQSEQRYRQLIDLSPDAIFVQSAGRIVLLNQACANLLGARDCRQLLGRAVMDHVHPDYSDIVLARIRQLTAGRQVDRLEEVFLRLDGSTVDVEVAAAPLTYQGKPAVQVIVRDISERKRADAALRDLSGRLLRARDEERRRIARELHDSTAQTLAALALKLGLLSQVPSLRSAPARRLLKESLSMAQETVRDVRTVSYLLHPPMLDEMGLTSALRWYAEGYQRRSGIRVTLDLPASLGRLPEEIETALFRVVQECLTNVHRHAGSPTARIALARHDGRLTLTVSDQGRGIPSGTLLNAGEAASRVGVGIAGMRERVRQLGGAIRFDSGPGGTTVHVTLPLSPPGWKEHDDRSLDIPVYRN